MNVVKKILKKIYHSGLMYKLYFVYMIAKSYIFRTFCFHTKRSNEKLKIIFLVMNISTWKLKSLYYKLIKDNNFEPIIVTIPLLSLDEKYIFDELDKTTNYFSNNGYNVVCSYDKKECKWLDLKKYLSPSAIFFTNPHSITKKEYLINNFLRYKTFYIPYSFRIDFLINIQFNQVFHNIVYKNYYETNIHKKIATENTYCKGNNVIVTGYPALEDLITRKENYDDVWKIKDRKIKRIIWAPHQTISEKDSYGLDWSCFLIYAYFMLDIAVKYKDEIQVAFKPHPFLKRNLMKDDSWGEKKTDDYFRMWDSLPNCQINENEYFDLFLSSDALMHDSGSFMVEYLVVNKPALYTLRDARVTDRFNEFGKMAFNHHYHATNEIQIEDFIKNIVLNNNDYLMLTREEFVSEQIMIGNNFSPSTLIINDLKKSFKIK